jgi:hypothetical protein
VSQGIGLEVAMDQIARQHKAIPFMLKKRKALYQGCIRKHSEGKLRAMLECASLIDEALKTGSKTCNPKDELLDLTRSEEIRADPRCHQRDTKTTSSKTQRLKHPIFNFDESHQYDRRLRWP